MICSGVKCLLFLEKKLQRFCSHKRDVYGWMNSARRVLSNYSELGTECTFWYNRNHCWVSYIYS